MLLKLYRIKDLKKIGIQRRQLQTHIMESDSKLSEKSGYLQVMSDLLKIWSKKFVSVKGPFLYIFEDQSQEKFD